MKISLEALSRRDFLKTSALAGSLLAAPAILPGNLFANTNSDTLKVGLIGCGGRGTGAAEQALSADKNVVLTAMADAFPEPLQTSFNVLQTRVPPEKFKVTPEKQFVGLDAYQKLIDSGVDVVLLTTPPGFRPVHLKAAIDAGKHVFCEKPMATDVPGVKSVIESAEKAKQKGLALVAGFCWRYDKPRREFYKRIHDGAIGDIRAIYATYYTGPVKPMPPGSERAASLGDLEWQMRNWYNFAWLSGDGLLEQACHSVDKAVWAMKDAPPLKAVAVGGRQTPNNEGNIFDHTFVVYEWPEDVRVFLGQRQIGNTHSDNSDYLMGSEGFGESTWTKVFTKGKQKWIYKEAGEKISMYQIEHNELFASIRNGKPINDGHWMAQSTLVGLMGRAAAYTGQEVTWEQINNSTEKLVPEKLDWKMKLDIPQNGYAWGHTTDMTRRDFIKSSTAAIAAAAVAPPTLAAEPAKRPIRKAIMWATVGMKGSMLEKMRAIKEAGFEGVEMMSHMDQDEVLKARDEAGLIIPSVCGKEHWGKPLTHPDPKIREESLNGLKQTLRDAKRYGASSVLLVPGVVNKEISYMDAYSRSQAEIRRAIPLAEELGVKIAIENVWNNFLLSPLEAARYVDEFDSPFVGWHFDIGNVLNTGWPEHWVPVLGKRIQKLHIKEYSRKQRDKEGLWKGFAVDFLQGDNNWPAIMKALDVIGYSGWGMTEQLGGDSPEGLKKLSDGYSKILAS